MLLCPAEHFFLKLHRLLIPALLHEGLGLLLPPLNLRWVGDAHLPRGLDQAPMVMLELLMATAPFPAELRRKRSRLSTIQQKAGEGDD